MFEPFYEFGFAATQYLQTWGDAVLSFMRGISFLGSEDLYILGFTIITWVIDYNFGLRIAYLFIFSGMVNSYFKQLLAQPRPYWVNDQIRNVSRVQANDFGFPSGHSQFAASIYGLFAVAVKRSWVTIFMVVMIFLLGLSRVALGAHFVHSVIAGWILGLLILWIFIKYEQPVKDWLYKKSMSQRNWYTFVLSIVFILIGTLVVGSHGAWEMPADWVKNAMIDIPGKIPNPLSLNTIITLSAFMFGTTAGYYQTETAGGFNAGGVWWRRLLRFLVGIVGVLVFWKGLDAIFPDTADLIGYTFRYIRYTLVGLWIGGWGPSVFVKLKLANRQQ